MSLQSDLLAEQESWDYLMSLGDGQRRELMEDLEDDTDERRKKYNKGYWDSHKKEISNHRKKVYKENREKILSRNKKWLDANRDKWNEYQRKYRLRKKCNLDNAKSD